MVAVEPLETGQHMPLNHDVGTLHCTHGKDQSNNDLGSGIHIEIPY